MTAQLLCVECDQPMKWLGTSVRWEGDYEYETRRFVCGGTCRSVTAEIRFRTFTPLELEPA